MLLQVRYTGIVPERCSCGAQPVEDALFCHKCGRPLREDLISQEVVETVTAEPPPMPVVLQPGLQAPAPPSIQDIGFHNPAAVRVALAVAVVSAIFVQIISAVPGGSVLMLPTMVLIGVVCVLVYRRKTGVALSTLSGARLGWLSGLFFFVIILMLFAVVAALAAASDLGFVGLMKKTLTESPAANAETRALAEKFSTDEMATFIMFVLALLFVLLTVLPSVGGMLGARFTRPRNEAR